MQKMLTLTDRYEAALAANPLRTQMLCTGVLFGGWPACHAHQVAISIGMQSCSWLQRDDVLMRATACLLPPQAWVILSASSSAHTGQNVTKMWSLSR